jgi:hypothetical protein
MTSGSLIGEYPGLSASRDERVRQATRMSVAAVVPKFLMTEVDVLGWAFWLA